MPSNCGLAGKQHSGVKGKKPRLTYVSIHCQCWWFGKTFLPCHWKGFQTSGLQEQDWNWTWLCLSQQHEGMDDNKDLSGMLEWLDVTLWREVLESCNSGSTPELPELRVLDGTLASAYVLRPCCRSCSVFWRCRRQIEKERRWGVILVDIQAKVYSGVSMSLYMEVKAD